MTDFELVNPLDAPERQIVKLKRIAASLIRRVEQDTDQSANAYSLFQRAIALEGEVHSRTRDLNDTLAELRRVNGELTAASAIAEEANRAKSRFLAAATHDVRQPLLAAKLFAASLQVGPLDESQALMVERLRSALGSVEAILEGLLDLSRLDSSSVEASVTEFPLMRILEPILNEFSALAMERGVLLTVTPSSLWVRSDPAYLRQIVQNLTSNAIRYCNGGRVVVGVRRRGGDARIEVHDDGPGIREQDIPLIFQEFKRLNQSDGQGVGLGLAIVERACKLLDHPLDMDSRPGRGVAFRVRAPLASSSAARALGESDETLIVLVAAGNADVRSEITALLDHWGMAAIAAASAREALERVRQLGVAPDRLLIDHAMERDQGAIALLEQETGAAMKAVLLLDRNHGEKPRPPGRPSLRTPVRPHRLRALLMGAHQEHREQVRPSP